MAIEYRCSGCNRALRVSHDHAGLESRCPICRATTTVPAGVSGTMEAELLGQRPGQPVEPPSVSVSQDFGGTEPLPSSSLDQHWDAPANRWVVRTPDGDQYGPVVREELNRWVREGRVTAECELAEEGSAVWQRASTMFNNLPHAPPPVSANSQNPYRAPTTTSPGSARPSSLRPHRGVLVLVFGLLGLLVCGFLAPVAWALGNSDLQSMRSGQMDPEGYGLTQAGMILGIIGTILLFLACACIFPALLAGV